MQRKTGIKIAAAFEIMNGNLSEPAKEVLLQQFAKYDDQAVLKALDRCLKECKGRITPGDVFQRIDDGRPGIEEAWATVDRARRDTNGTVVWTDEMAEAFGFVEQMDDDVAARMSFKGAYQRLCDESRDKGLPVKWTPSLGSYDSRSGPLLEAVRLGRLSPTRARKLVPELPPMQGEETKTLPLAREPEYEDPAKVKELVCDLVNQIGGVHD